MTSNTEERSILPKKRKDAPLVTALPFQREKLSATTQEGLRSREARSKQINKNNVLLTANKALVKLNTNLTIANFKALNTVRRLKKISKQFQEFQEISGAATEELIAAKDEDLKKERIISLAKDEHMHKTEMRLYQTEQELARLRTASALTNVLAGNMFQFLDESNLHQSTRGLNVPRVATSKADRYLSLKGLSGISEHSNSTQEDSASRFTRDLNRNTIDSMGQVFAIWGRNAPVPTAKQQRVALIQLVHTRDEALVPRSHVNKVTKETWRALIYTVVKNVYQVEYCTHITLREMQVVVTRFNQWVRNVLGELHMLSTAEKDLETLIGPPAAADLLVRQQLAQPLISCNISVIICLECSNDY